MYKGNSRPGSAGRTRRTLPPRVAGRACCERPCSVLRFQRATRLGCLRHQEPEGKPCMVSLRPLPNCGAGDASGGQRVSPFGILYGLTLAQMESRNKSTAAGMRGGLPSCRLEGGGDCPLPPERPLDAVRLQQGFRGRRGVRAERKGPGLAVPALWLSCVAHHDVDPARKRRGQRHGSAVLREKRPTSGFRRRHYDGRRHRSGACPGPR